MTRTRLGWAVPVQLVAVQFTTLSAELPGKIDRINVKEGERFKEGQQLVAFDCVIQRAQLDEAQAILGAAEKSKSVHKRLLKLNSAGMLETEKSASDAAVAQAKLNSARAVTTKCGIPGSGRYWSPWAIARGRRPWRPSPTPPLQPPRPARAG